MFIAPINLHRFVVLLFLMVSTNNLIAQKAVSKNLIGKNSGTPEFNIEIESDYQASFGCSLNKTTNTYIFTNSSLITATGENFASDIIVDLGATFGEIDFENLNATLDTSLNSAANLIEIYINGIQIPAFYLEKLDGRYRVKISELNDGELGSFYGFEDLDNDGFHDDLREGGTFSITTKASPACFSNQSGYNAARIIFNNNDGTKLRLQTEKNGYNLGNHIVEENNGLVFPENILEFSDSFDITANAKAIFSPEAYLGCANQYSELIIDFSEDIDFSNITFSDSYNRNITYKVNTENNLLIIKIPLINNEFQSLENFNLNDLKINCSSSSFINVEWTWNYVCEDCSTCKVEWLSGSNTIKTTDCISFDLGVRKSVNDDRPYVDDEVEFTSILKNNGVIEASSVVLNDLLPNGYEFISVITNEEYNSNTGEWKIDNIQPSEEKILKLRAKVLATGNFDSTVSLISYTGGEDENENNNISTTTTFPIQPKIELLQEGIFNDENNDNYAQIGESITYTYKISNIGNTTLTDVLVSDDMVTITGNLINTLDINSEDATTFFGTYIITQDDIDIGAVQNKSQVVSYDIKGNLVADIAEDINGLPPIDDACIDCSVVLIPQNKSISLVKSYYMDDTNNDGIIGNTSDNITYTLDVINNGTVTLTNIEITDVMLELFDAPISIISLTPNNQSQLTATYQINQEDEAIGYVENTASVKAESLYGDINNPEDDIIDISDTGTDINGHEINNPNEVESPEDIDQNMDGDPTNDLTIAKLNNKIDLAITKDVNNDFPFIGDKIVFSIKVVNLGNISAQNVIVTDNLPSGYEYISHTVSAGNYSYATGDWFIDELQLEETLTVTVKVLEEGDYLNIATISGYQGGVDSDLDNNEDSAEITPACLTIYNEFSPNGDGQNETFEIDCIENYKDNQLSVFNRWGNTVFEQSNYNNTWDGTSKIGKNLPTGTYYYVLKLGNGFKDKTGWLYINR